MSTSAHACQHCDATYTSTSGHTGLCPACAASGLYCECGRELRADGSCPDGGAWCGNITYAEQDEEGQLSIGVTGEQRAIPGLAAAIEWQNDRFEA